jgi:hypothetical protein
MQALRATLLAAGLGITGMAAAPTAVAIPGYQPCPSPPGYQIEVKGMLCSDSWLFDAYNFDDGGKYQQIMNFTCYSSTVDQKPIVLTCVSSDGELVVSAI